MYFTKAIVLALLPIAAVNAMPAPVPEPGIKDFFQSVASKATSVWGSAAAEVTASSLYKDATKVLGTSTSQVYATIITTNGVPVAQVTSVGGPAITLATDTKSGMATSFAGHTFTVPSVSPTSTSSSASATNSHNAAVGSFALSKGTLMSVAGVAGGVLAGALVVL